MYMQYVTRCYLVLLMMCHLACRRIQNCADRVILRIPKPGNTTTYLNHFIGL